MTIKRVWRRLIRYTDIEWFINKSASYGKYGKWLIRGVLFPYMAILCLISVPKKKSKYKVFQKYNKIFKIKRKGVMFYLPSIEYNAGITKGDYIQKEIYMYSDYYEAVMLDKLKKKGYIKEKMNVLDIGANIGNHMLFFTKEMCAKSVHCFEPINETYELLRKNIEINDVNVVKTYNFALGRNSSNANIDKFSADNAGGISLTYDKNGGIKVHSLDSLEIPEKIDFIKIDVEGFEEEVLLGAQEKILSDKPVIFIEIFERNFNNVDRLLKEMNYAMKEKLEAENYVYTYNGRKI